MKAIKSKILSLLLTICIVAAVIVIPVYASDTADVGYDWNACASDVRKAYLSASEEESDTFAVSPEYLSRSYEANSYYDRILNYIENTPGELREHFSGAYVNDDGYLVVLLCCLAEADQCQSFILNDLDCENALFEVGKRFLL